MSLPKIFSINSQPLTTTRRQCDYTLNPVLYKQLSEPNTCGFERMSAMNIDLSMNILPQIASKCLLLSLFFPVLSLRYVHPQLSSLYLLSTFTASHVRKNTRLSTPAQLQCSHSGAWEPGNEAKRI